MANHLLCFLVTFGRLAASIAGWERAMKTYRIWIEILGKTVAAACAITVLFVSIGLFAGATSGTLEQDGTSKATETYEGVVTCSHCGARHSAKIAQTAADCARMCVHGGSQFALVDGEKVYLLDGNLEILKKAAGERVKIKGTMSGNTIHVVMIADMAS